MKKKFIFNEHVDFFVSKCKDFLTQNLDKKIDFKHENLLAEFKKIYKKDKENFISNLRNWSHHGDLSCPPQITFIHLKYIGFGKTILNFLKKITKFFDLKFFNQSFFDDLEILKKTGSLDILKQNPVHETPQCDDFYYFEKTSSNYRWNRYAYLLNKVRQENLLKDNCNYIDIGSFYGGFQSCLKKIYPKTNLILLDFNHQLCRSYVYLKNLFPNSKHTLPDDISNLEFLNENEDQIVYLPIEKRSLLKKLNIHLTTNFFSFGEMKREMFNEYFELIDHSKYIYLVNRFVSSPFFEKTYDSDLDVRDYLKKNYNTLYFDIFPMHHYLNIKRKLLNKYANRPVSSPYFELILKKI